MKKLSHICYCPFTGLGIKEFGGNEWFDYRVDIFNKYVVPSLKNQTAKDFTLWISFRNEERYKPQIDKLENALNEVKIKHIFTYDGIMMYDDRGLKHNEDLEERMGKSLTFVKNQLIPSEWVYKTDLGSDDLFHKDALSEVQQQEPREKGATYYINGYILNMQTGQLAEWNRESSCSKYTIMYPYETFFDAKKHLEYVKGLQSHEFVPLVFDATRLPDGRYMCGVHGANISTTWQNKERGREFLNEEKNNVLQNFGIDF